MNQGESLATISYGIGILPPTHEICATHPHVIQPWYADDASAGGKFADIQEHMREMMVLGPLQGYSPEPTKSILVVSPRVVLKAEEYFRGMGVRVVSGICYLGGFIGDPVSEDAWLDEKLKGWRELVEVLEGVALRHL